MKTRNILIFIFLFFSAVSNAQIITKTSDLKEEKVEVKDFNQLNSIDWKKLKEKFKGINPEQDISLTFKLSEEALIELPDSSKNSFSFTTTFRAGNFDLVTGDLKKIFKQLAENSKKKEKG